MTNRDTRYRQTLTKEERLSKKNDFTLLFKRGKSINIGPIKTFYYISDTDTGFPISVAFAVPKKHFKCAVDRNKLKRVMREGYRLNKSHLLNSLIDLKKNIMLLFLYQNKEIVNSKNIHKYQIKILEQIQEKLTTN